eukprot:TRINITY_DN3714_c0_g2_i1.p1 TRINITY_DN3714_c0_g2~~TRINITY_DN3714_c0_g2_i1.p1  ORF type:complete len:669 (+),score=94.96 TRINITY_DN3714_c0_g2_i1:58-2007(+)
MRDCRCPSGAGKDGSNSGPNGGKKNCGGGYGGGGGGGGPVPSGGVLPGGTKPAWSDKRHAGVDNATQEDQCHPRKLFIGGLAHKTTTLHLRDHFVRFGTIVDAVVLRWPDGRSRGFGYVTFSDAQAASAAIKEKHQLGGRPVDVKRAVPGTNKLFVGGLPQNTSATELREHFESFGVVSDAVVMIDPATSRSRGFGFICFLPGQEGAAAVTAALEKYDKHRLRGKWIEVKSACPPHKLVSKDDCDMPPEKCTADSASDGTGESVAPFAPPPVSGAVAPPPGAPPTLDASLMLNAPQSVETTAGNGPAPSLYESSVSASCPGSGHDFVTVAMTTAAPADMMAERCRSNRAGVGQSSAFATNTESSFARTPAHLNCDDNRAAILGCANHDSQHFSGSSKNAAAGDSCGSRGQSTVGWFQAISGGAYIIPATGTCNQSPEIGRGVGHGETGGTFFTSATGQENSPADASPLYLGEPVKVALPKPAGVTSQQPSTGGVGHAAAAATALAANPTLDSQIPDHPKLPGRQLWLHRGLVGPTDSNAASAQQSGGKGFPPPPLFAAPMANMLRSPMGAVRPPLPPAHNFDVSSLGMGARSFAPPMYLPTAMQSCGDPMWGSSQFADNLERLLRQSMQLQEAACRMVTTGRTSARPPL